MSQNRDFRNWIRSNRAVGDGAMATLLHQLGVPVRTCYEELCLSSPQMITRVHQEYVDAGADIIQTNTFSGHRPGLERYDLGHQVTPVNRAAVRLARQAAGEKAFVFGTIGSIMGLHPGTITFDAEVQSALEQQFREQMDALLSEGIDGLLLETFPDLGELGLAVATARKLTSLPIIAHLSPETVGVTRDGVEVGLAFQKLRDAGADIVGLNCQLGVAGILRTFEGLDLSPTGVYSAYPNAGMLKREGDDLLYTAGPDYFGQMAQKLYELGVQIVGGCCGTTPSHVKAIAKARQAAGITEGNRREVQRTTGPSQAATIFASGSPHPSSYPDSNADTKDRLPTLVEKAQRETTVIVELDPPRTLDTTRFMEGARALAEAGTDFITMADNSLGHVRVSNIALASKLRQEGIEPLVHITCRDRNLIGQQSHLMGLHVLGVHHILLVTGDPSRFGDLPGASSVYDTSSIELTSMVKRLNNGIAFSGQHLKEPSQFVIGTSFNPNVKNVERAYQRLERKVNAGADYVMTQPLFAKEQIQDLARRTKHLQVPVFVGIMPLVSMRNAYFLDNEVPGIHIPPETLERMENCHPESAAAEGTAIAKELIDDALQYFHSIYLITPFLRYSMTEELVRYIRQATVKSASVSETH